MGTEPLAAVLLAGGRGSRLGGADKPGLVLGSDGRTLLARAISAARSAGCDPVVLVGPARTDTATPDPGLLRIREDPPFGGPVAAIATALAALVGAPVPLVAGIVAAGQPRVAPERREEEGGQVLVLATDLARPDLAVAALRREAPGPDGAILVDPDGREQWLAAVYRVAALRERLAALGDPTGTPVRAFVAGLELRRVPATPAEVADVDTWEDFERLAREEQPHD